MANDQQYQHEEHYEEIPEWVWIFDFFNFMISFLN
jgi:hypothetical protein